MALYIFTYLTYLMLMLTANVNFLWDMQSCAKMLWNAPYLQYFSTNNDISWCIWYFFKEYVKHLHCTKHMFNLYDNSCNIPFSYDGDKRSIK